MTGQDVGKFLQNVTEMTFSTTLFTGISKICRRVMWLWLHWYLHVSQASSEQVTGLGFHVLSIQLFSYIFMFPHR